MVMLLLLLLVAVCGSAADAKLPRIEHARLPTPKTTTNANTVMAWVEGKGLAYTLVPLD